MSAKVPVCAFCHWPMAAVAGEWKCINSPSCAAAIHPAPAANGPESAPSVSAEEPPEEGLEFSHADTCDALLLEDDNHCDCGETIRGLRARLARTEQGLKPFIRFIDAWDAQPLDRTDDFYGIHTGTKWEASLRLSEFRALRALVSPTPSSEEQHDG